MYTEECGASYCAAAKLVKAQELKRGDRVYASDGAHSRAAAVTAVAKGQAQVKYIVTEAGNLVVNGVVASVFSTLALGLETLPFHTMLLARSHMCGRAYNREATAYIGR